MTDPSFDEIASAHLDGTSTPTEAARVAGDPALQARVEELRQIRDAVAAVPAVDPVHRDLAIAAALAAFAETAPVATVTAIAARRGPSPRAVRILGAAAAVALLALLVPVLGRLARSDEDMATSFDSTGDAIAGAAPESADSAVPDGSRTTTTASSNPRAALGAFDDISALAAALAANGPAALALEPDATTSGGVAGSPTCPPREASITDATRQVETAVAVVAGDPVVVVVRTDDAGARTLLVYRAADCALVAARPL